jgi:hypothetical protein
MKSTYHGSCHCRAVTSEADLDLSQGTAKRNCTLCWKQRMWRAYGKPGDLRLTGGEDVLVDYHGRDGSKGEGRDRFCGRCGIILYAEGELEQLGGAFVAVQLSALDDLPPAVLLSAPVRTMDGLHDNWENPPAEARHL